MLAAGRGSESWETSAVPVLAIDTSAAVAVALTDDDGVLLASRSVDSPRHHAELLAPMVRDVLAEAGLVPGDVSAVAVGTGPAPFTGLRAGLVTARMFALARAIPLYGVSSLDALAADVLLPAPATPPARESVISARVSDSAVTDSRISHYLGEGGEARVGTEVLVVADARRREVYAARYRAAADGDVELVAGPVVERPDDVAELARDAVVVGRGAAVYAEAFPGASGPLVPDPAVLARLAIVRARRAVDQPAEPLYLRRPDAVPAAGRKRATR